MPGEHPQNYALEVAPYWLTEHTDLTFERYQHPGFRSALQTLSISVATAPLKTANGTSGESAGTRIGLGVRTILLNGHFDDTLNTRVRELEKINFRLLDLLNEMAQLEEKIAAAEAPGAAAGDGALEETRVQLADLQARWEEVEAEAVQAALQIQALDVQRVGFILTVAAGRVWAVPEDDLAQAGGEGWGGWATSSYRFRACGASSSNCTATIERGRRSACVVRARARHDLGHGWSPDLAADQGFQAIT